MANMSYCRFENTSRDLQDCLDAMAEREINDMSDYEKRAFESMREQCEEYIRLFDEIEEEKE
jgi:hypothetical protein